MASLCQTENAIEAYQSQYHEKHGSHRNLCHCLDTVYIKTPVPEHAEYPPLPPIVKLTSYQVNVDILAQRI